jgi:hypothetical protein
MIFYYAAGGGLGHLTRARAVIHTLPQSEPVTILTASPFADDRRVVGDAKIIKIPQAFATDRRGYQDWLQALFAKHQPSEIFLDAFPAGLFGEFCNFPFPVSTRLIHVARLLRWEEYGKQLHGSLPQFDVTYELEPLAPVHEQFLRQQSKAFQTLLLEDPPHELTGTVKELAVRIMRPSVKEYTLINRQQAIHKPIWLIVHAGSNDETQELIAYAQEMSRIERVTPRLILISPQRSAIFDHPILADRQTPLPRLQTPDSRLQTSSLEHFDFYPAAAFFPLAERIVTACGFNACRQMDSYREKHRFLPFARRFDDQFRRAAYRRTA